MDLVDRLYHRLIQAVEPSANGADPSTTVGDIYQRLIPYRAMRNEVGVWELAEYEHGLVRLLSGERDYIALDPTVQDELRREIASPNPILGIYRDYSATPARIRRPPSGSAVAPPSIRPLSVPQPPSAPPSQAPTSASPATGRDCAVCSVPLPPIDGLRFCPKCGSDQLESACRDCGARLRPDWNFCIRCGKKKDAGE